MAVYYFDSSAIVKQYISETGSAWVATTTDPSSGNDILVSLLARIEVPAAIFKRCRERSITHADAHSAAAQFVSDFANRYQPMEVTLSLIEDASILAEKHGLRAYDSVQLATALAAQALRDALGLAALVFTSADDDLNAAAQRESLPVENPNQHP